MDAPDVSIANIKLSSEPSYKLGQSLATRQAYGKHAFMYYVGIFLTLCMS